MTAFVTLCRDAGVGTGAGMFVAGAPASVADD